jgi:hypothetical protein
MKMVTPVYNKKREDGLRLGGTGHHPSKVG